jgi:hypothetical protein
MIKSWHSKLSYPTAANRPAAYMRAAALCRTNVHNFGMFKNLQMEKELSP